MSENTQKREDKVMKTMLVMVALLLAGMGSTLAFAAPVTLNPTADAGCTSWYGSGTSNYGGGLQLFDASIVSYGGSAFTMMNWDLSAIPTGAVVTSATFRWHYDYQDTAESINSGRQIVVYQSSAPWQEMAVTFNNAPAAGAELFTMTIPPNSAYDYKELISSSTDPVLANRALANWVSSGLANPTLATNGWVMTGPAAENQGVKMGSRESVNKPELIVDYTIPEPSIFLALAAGMAPLLIRRKQS